MKPDWAPWKTPSTDDLGECSVVLSPADPEHEQCAESASCDPEVGSECLEPRIDSVFDSSSWVPSTAPLGAPSTYAFPVGRQDAPCSFWARKIPPDLTDFFSQEQRDKGLLSSPWMFMGVDPSAGCIPPFSIMFPDNRPIYLASTIRPFATFGELPSPEPGARRFRYWVGAMHFTMVLLWDNDTDAFGISDDLRDLPYRVGAFMAFVDELRAHTVRRVRWEFDDSRCTRFLTTQRRYPCGEDPDFARSVNPETLVVDSMSMEQSGRYYLPEEGLLGVAAVSQPSQSAATSLLGRMICAEVDVPAGEDEGIAALARRGFECVFGREVKVGVSMDYLPFGHTETNTAFMRTCVPSNDLLSVAALRRRVDALLATDPEGLAYHDVDMLSIEADLAASS